MRQIPDPLNVRGLLQEGATTVFNDLAALARNRVVEINYGEDQLTGTVRSLHIHPSATPNMMGSDIGFDALERVVVALDQVTWAGRRADSMEIAIEDVRVAQRPRPRITGGPVTVQVTIPLTTLTDWLAESDIHVDMTADASDDGLTVRYRFWRLPFVAEAVPRATARTGVLTVRKLKLYGRRVPLPKKFDLSLSVALPLDESVRIREARLLDSNTLAVEAQVISMDYPISLQQIIDSLRSGGDRSVLNLGKP